jgi:hypothetical protein
MKRLSAIVIILIIIFSADNTAQTQWIDSVFFDEGDSISTSFALKGGTISGLILPDSLVGNTITFQDSWDGTTYNTALKYDSSKIKILIPYAGLTPNRKVIPLLAEIWGLSLRAKLKSGGTAQTDSCWVYIEMKK